MHLLPTTLFMACVLALAIPTRAESQPALPDSLRNFGALATRLSEAGGYFDTDNLISNESSYLHVIPAIERLGIRGGAYIGVGPDQNFSYIARIRPRVAFIVDIRRDNMLQQLMYKALFARSTNRASYLALLLGKPLPPRTATWSDSSIVAIVTWLDQTPSSRSADTVAERLLRDVGTYGIALSENDRRTIERFYRTFVAEGLSLQFTSTGRAPRPYYPTLRQLILERDRNGQRASYLARETDFQFVRQMQQRHLVVPVVGDLAGASALNGIGAYLREHRESVSAIYVSNAEDYLFRGGSFRTYASNIAQLPLAARSVMIRSYFGGPGALPQSVGDSYSTQLLQHTSDFVALAPALRNYRELALKSVVQ